MLECILTDARKSGPAQRSSRESTFSWHVPLEPLDDNNVSSQPGLDQCSPRSERRPSVDEQLLIAGGVMRERTSQFGRLRASMNSGRQRVPNRDEHERACASNKELSDELSRTFQEASSLHTSLASKLAQHNGVRQFAADFKNRAPPLELRMLLPQLEASVKESLDRLEPLSARLRELQSTASGRNRQLCNSLAEHVASIFVKSSETFKEQREHLEKLAAASPLFSPVLNPALRQRLATAMSGSPSSSTAASPMMSPRVSPPGSPSLPSRLQPPPTASTVASVSDLEPSRLQLPPTASTVASVSDLQKAREDYFHYFHRRDDDTVEKTREGSGGYRKGGNSQGSPFDSILADQVRRKLQADQSETNAHQHEDLYQENEAFDLEMVVEGCDL